MKTDIKATEAVEMWCQCGHRVGSHMTIIVGMPTMVGCMQCTCSSFMQVKASEAILSDDSPGPGENEGES
jgi:hypothetical protein